jgi:ribA/ribD-fused uncharacterized protein
MSNGIIEQFSGEYRWLSNFWFFDKPKMIENSGSLIQLDTNEHYYIAMKTNNTVTRKKVAEHSIKGLKRFGTTFSLRKGWDKMKLQVMEEGLRYKFSKHNPRLRGKLIETGSRYIQEGNKWGDTFWGVDLRTGKGDNNLGKILMTIRSEIQYSDPHVPNF